MSVGQDLTVFAAPLTWGRAGGLQLLGPVQDSGLRETTFLVRRQDGQVVQLSELLYKVLDQLAPARSPAEVASAVSVAFGRQLTAEGLEHLMRTRLVPLGLAEPVGATATDTPSPDAEAPGWTPADTRHGAPTARPLLSLSVRGTLVPTRWVQRIAGPLASLFLLPLIVTALACVVLLDVALLRSADLLGALQQVLTTPALLVGLYVVLTTGALIHELGHAAACMRGGGRPGAIGFGIYLLFPAFYTDVTDSYRLGRRARLRTDLGGLYFNVLTLIILAVLHEWTGAGFLLLAIVLMHIEMLQQLVPVVRLDGYYVLADLAGVPDLFARVGPVLRSLRPGAATDPRVAELRPGARRTVVAWVLFVVPALVAATGWLVWNLPLIVGQTLGALRAQATGFVAAWRVGDVALVLLSAFSVVLLAVPLLGLVVLGWRAASGARSLTSRLAHRSTAWGAALVRGQRSLRSLHPRRGLRRGSHRPVMTESSAEESSMSVDPVPPALAVARDPAESWDQPGTAAEFRDAVMLPARTAEPRHGWRHAVYRASGHSLNLGPGPAERRLAELEARLRTPISGSRRVVVMSRKGGVGKTTITLALGSTFSELRGDRAIAVDANPDAGNLAHRVSVPNSRTVTDVLRDLDRIDRYATLRSYTSQAPESRLEVLASDDDPRIGMALDRDDYHRLIGLLDHYYNLILLDTGTGILDSANQGLLGEADQLVLVLRAGLDGGRAAALTLDWLDEHGFDALVERAVVVVNAVRHGLDTPVEAMVQHFERRCRRVVQVPWDPALEAGAQTRLSDLSSATRQGLIEMAAAVADGFDEDGARP
jgi:putative peptide zinc metalloprotease protein